MCLVITSSTFRCKYLPAELNMDVTVPKWMVDYSNSFRAGQKKKPTAKTCQVQGVSVASQQEKKIDDPISGLLISNDIASKCDTLLDRAASSHAPVVLGLDVNWPATDQIDHQKTSSIHLCHGDNQCSLFEVKSLKKLPLVFWKLLSHSHVRLIGQNILNDLLQLSKDFNYGVKEIIKTNLILSAPTSEKLSCEHQWTYNSRGDSTEQPLDEKIVEDPTPVAKFNGKIVYGTTFVDCAAYSEELLKRATETERLVLGFDLEWPFHFRTGAGKVALIQICPDPDICYIFHVFRLKSLPKALVVLIKHPNVRLTGLNIANDIRKLGRDFHLHLAPVLENNLIELSKYANEKLQCHHRWSLARLVENQLKVELEKGSVRISDWSQVNLSSQQLSYAATDAYNLSSNN